LKRQDAVLAFLLWASCGGRAPRISALSVGERHGCALLSVGRVECWGGNDRGQLGNGSTAEALASPVAVSGAAGVRALAAGNLHTCSLGAGATLRCWGDDQFGQLGDGSMRDATAIAARGQHTCAIARDGSVACWGGNDYGQLGDATTRLSPAPVVVATLAGVTALAAGDGHTCAVRTGGRVSCWGWNQYGQLGDGSTRDSPRPVDAGTDGVTAVAAARHTCAVRRDGSVVCWGWNAYGQLGDGSTDDAARPVTVAGVREAIAIAVGAAHSCALVRDGSVLCWGDNYYGQLGRGTSGAADPSRPPPPAPVAVLGPATAVAAGEYHTCALLADGTAACWGWNQYGQLGDETTRDSSLPVPVGAP
jgi:alpha-tubulin suppressor-like RCC1 family protein